MTRKAVKEGDRASNTKSTIKDKTKQRLDEEVLYDRNTNRKLLGVLGTLFMGISTARILDFLYAYRDFEYSEIDIARHSGISARQLYRALPILVAGGLVYQSGKEGRKKMYRLNRNAKSVHHLERMLFSLIDNKSNMSLMQSAIIEEPEINKPPMIS